MHTFDEILWGYAGGAGAYHNRGTMGVVGTEVKAEVTAHFLEADPDVGLEVFNEVAYMDWAICVGQGRCYNDFTGHSFS